MASLVGRLHLVRGPSRALEHLPRAPPTVALTEAERSARYRAAHPELIRDRKRAYRESRLTEAQRERRQARRERPPQVVRPPREKVGDRRERIRAMKRGGCEQCGVCPDDPRALHFHHRDPASKVASVTRVTRSGRWSEVVAELAKCELLCKECHKERHR